jgi:hypothetical protein
MVLIGGAEEWLCYPIGDEHVVRIRGDEIFF